MKNLCYMLILFLSVFNIAKIETNQDVDDTLVLWYPLPIKGSQIKSHNRTSLQKLLKPYLLHWHDLQDNEKCKQNKSNHVPVLNTNRFLANSQSLLQRLLEAYNHKEVSQNHTSIDLAAPNKQDSSSNYSYGNHEKDNSHKDESTINNEETEEKVIETSDEDTETSTTNTDFSLETSTLSIQTENPHTTVEINNRIFIQNSTSSDLNSETITKRTHTESNLDESSEDKTNSQHTETTQSLNPQENDTVTDTPEDYEIWTEIYYTNADYLNLENSIKDHEDSMSHENTATHEDTKSHTNTASLEDILSPKDASNGEDTTSENSASLEDATNNENTSTDTSVTLTNKDEEIQSRSIVSSNLPSSEDGTSFSSEESTTEHTISTDSIIDKRLLDTQVNNENDETEEDIVAEETITESSIVNENKPLHLLIQEYLKSQNISEDVSLPGRNKPCKCLYLITKLLIRDYLLHSMPTDVTNNN